MHVTRTSPTRATKRAEPDLPTPPPTATGKRLDRRVAAQIDTLNTLGRRLGSQPSDAHDAGASRGAPPRLTPPLASHPSHAAAPAVATVPTLPAHVAAAPSTQDVQATVELLNLGVRVHATERAIATNQVCLMRDALTQWLRSAPSLGLSSGFVVAIFEKAVVAGELALAVDAFTQFAQLPLVPINGRAHIAVDVRLEPPLSVRARRKEYAQTRLDDSTLGDLIGRPSGLGVLFTWLMYNKSLLQLGLRNDDLERLGSRIDGDEDLQALGQSYSTLVKLGCNESLARTLLFAPAAARKIQAAVEYAELFLQTRLSFAQFVIIATCERTGISEFLALMHECRYGSQWADYSDRCANERPSQNSL